MGPETWQGSCGRGQACQDEAQSLKVPCAGLWGLWKRSRWGGELGVELSCLDWCVSGPEGSLVALQAVPVPLLIGSLQGLWAGISGLAFPGLSSELIVSICSVRFYIPSLFVCFLLPSPG